MSGHRGSWAKPPHRVKLLNVCSGLNGHPRREGQPQMVTRRTHREETACHSETRTFPELVETLLSSTFLAQVLGQGQPTTRTDATLGARAYGRAHREGPAPQLLRLV